MEGRWNGSVREGFDVARKGNGCLCGHVTVKSCLDFSMYFLKVIIMR